MTETQRRFFDLAHRRIARLEPDVIAAVLAVFRSVTASLSDAELARLIAARAVERIVDSIVNDAAFTRALLPLRQTLRATTETAFRWTVPDLPRGGKVNGEVAVFYDRLNPRVIEAIRNLESRITSTLSQDMRATIRQYLERGIGENQTAKTIAKGLRDVIGLAPNQEAAVANFERMLREGDREAFTRLLRDRRFDRTLDKALGEGGTGLSEAQITRMVTAYRKRMTAFHAETVSRTAVLDSYKIAQRESWKSAIDAGLVERGQLMRQWIGVNDDRERDSHLAMNDTIVPFDSPYPNGQNYPGEGEFNCRCLDRIFFARSA